jgi:hypothetical protein
MALLFPRFANGTRTYFIYRRVMRCGQDGPDARRPRKAICRYRQGGQRSSLRAGAWKGPRLRGCDRGGAHRHADSIRRAWPAAGSHLRPRAQALLRPPRAVLAATRVGRGDLGAYCCRSPLQYRHIAAGNPPKSASHLASVAHVPIYEIGSKMGRHAGDN